MKRDEQPCTAPDPLGREHYACCYPLGHDDRPHRWVPTDDHWSVKLDIEREAKRKHGITD